ncbi:MAG: CoA-transferase [Gemmatimonadota bacterium]
MHDAVAAHVHDGDVVALEGFTHLISFAAAHEIIRQKRRNLTLCRLTPDLVADQMIAAGCVSKLVFSWAGNPGVGSLHAFRRAVESSHQAPVTSHRSLELEEYSHFGMVGRFAAGAAGLPFWPLRNYADTDLPGVNSSIRTVTCPFTGDQLAAVPALTPDITIVHAQRADKHGNTQMWGVLGVQKEAAFAAERVVVVVEEVVDESVVRSDPNRTVIPGFIVDAVVHEPWGAHPSNAQGYYDRDNAFYSEWEAISRDAEALKRYLDEFVYGVADRSAYLKKVPALRERLTAKPAMSGEVNYGF